VERRTKKPVVLAFYSSHVLAENTIFFTSTFMQDASDFLLCLCLFGFQELRDVWTNLPKHPLQVNNWKGFII